MTEGKARKEALTGKIVVLGLQHTFVMFGATILVPIITGLDVGVTLFAAGTGTLLFHFLTQWKVPVFLGSSFAFIPGLLAVGQNNPALIPYALGGIVIAGLLYLAAAALFMVVPYGTIRKILPPHVTGSMIILIGLILAPVAVSNANGTYSPELAASIGTLGCWALALFTFGLGVFVKIGLAKSKFPFLSALPVLLALVGGYLISVLFGLVDFSSVQSADFLGVPTFTLPRFSATAITVMVPIAVVTIVEHFGDVLAIGNVVEKDFVKDPGIHRTLLGDGLATTFSAFIGGPANTTYSENTGAIAFTGVHNPVVMRIAALFAIALALIPKFTALVSTVPAPVIGGISILLFGMISSIGIKSMVDARVNLGDPKILIVSATMLVLGLGEATFEFGNVQLSGLGLAAIAGVVLNLILNYRDITGKS